MTMDIKTANEIIALFEGRKKTMLNGEWWWSDKEQMDLFQWKEDDLRYHSDYGWLMLAVCKFGELTFEDAFCKETHSNSKKYLEGFICWDSTQNACLRLAGAIQFLAYTPEINLPKEYWPNAKV